MYSPGIKDSVKRPCVSVFASAELGPSAMTLAPPIARPVSSLTIPSTLPLWRDARGPAGCAAAGAAVATAAAIAAAGTRVVMRLGIHLPKARRGHGSRSLHGIIPPCDDRQPRRAGDPRLPWQPDS